MKYLKNFETDPQYQLYMGGEPILPNVSYVKDDNLIYYNPDPTNGHPYVEIGGIKWATMNIGATSETDPGLYFQWGDTVGYTASQVGTGDGQKAFTWADYKWSDNGSSSVFTKYNSTDNKTVLDLEDDAARINWGGKWKLPTYEEMVALVNNSNIILQSNVFKFTDKNDSSKTITFPKVLIAYNGKINTPVSLGWMLFSTNSLHLSIRGLFWNFWGSPDLSFNFSTKNRCIGFPIRPVIA